MSLSINSTNYSTLFGSLSNSGSTSSSNSLSSNFYADYASIKNGSYAKLTKAYYSKQSSSASDSTDSTSLKAEFSAVKGASSDLSKSVSKLTDESLYKKIKTKDENGNETEDYDWDKITSALNSFVDSYNDLVKEGGDSSSKSVLTSTLSMVKNTSANENLLSKIGITVNSDNTLSLDEDAVKKADATSIKTIFGKNGSFADRVASKAATIQRVADNSINKLGNYNSSGLLSSLGTTGSIYDGLY